MNKLDWLDNPCLSTMCFFFGDSTGVDPGCTKRMLRRSWLHTGPHPWHVFTLCEGECRYIQHFFYMFICFLPTNRMYTRSQLCLRMRYVCFLLRGICSWDNSFCPNYDIRMLENYSVNKIPFERGLDFLMVLEAGVFSGLPHNWQPASPVQEAWEHPQAKTSAKTQKQKQAEAWRQQLSWQLDAIWSQCFFKSLGR